MALYTSTQTTSSGIVVNAVLDTVTNTITYTATTPNGVIATSTQDTNPPGLRALFRQLIEGNVGSVETNTGANVFIGVLNSVYDNVKSQAATATAAAEVTSEPPPQESQPIPVNPTVDPQQEAFLEANQEPARVIEEPPTDEFEGVDLAVATQENALKEPPVLSEEETNQYLREVETPKYESPPEVDTSQDAAENAKFSRQQEEANAPKSENPGSKGSSRGLTGKVKKTRQQATAQDNANYNLLKDWRIRLALAENKENSNYLYNADPPGILAPLRETRGVIFPYLPTVTINYVANYDPTEVVHSNYKIFQYRSSAIDQISITGEFTAQDTKEANYLLAVIHFFRSVTKMFYGQDSLPINGTPPPLCFLYGYGQFNFDQHPLVISNFTCTFPNDVDYIRATTHDTIAGVNTSNNNVTDNSGTPQEARMSSAKVSPGGGNPNPNWGNSKTSSNNTGSTIDATYVPTKMTVQISAYPVVSRNDISRNFSLKNYASGKLLRKGIW